MRTDEHQTIRCQAVVVFLFQSLLAPAAAGAHFCGAAPAEAWLHRAPSSLLSNAGVDTKGAADAPVFAGACAAMRRVVARVCRSPLVGRVLLFRLQPLFS